MWPNLMEINQSVELTVGSCLGVFSTHWYLIFGYTLWWWRPAHAARAQPPRRWSSCPPAVSKDESGLQGKRHELSVANDKKRTLDISTPPRKSDLWSQQKKYTLLSQMIWHHCWESFKSKEVEFVLKFQGGREFLVHKQKPERSVKHTQ